MAGPCFRVWTYSSPAIVLGCSQRSLREAAEERLDGRAELLERESGGGAVLTGPWLVSASVVLPLRHPWLSQGLLEGYRRLGQLHVAALQACGVATRAVPPQELPRTQETNAVSSADWACFGSLSPWEVVNAEGRKLVGLAQRRRQSGVLLVAGTLVAQPDWPLLCEAMGYPEAASGLRQRTVSCTELMARPVVSAMFAEALTQWLEHSLA